MTQTSKDPNQIFVDIVSDTVCPWCFIGKRRLEAALAEVTQSYEIHIAWRPFQLNPDMPAGGMDRTAYLEAKFGGSEGAKSIYDNINNAGEDSGIAFNFPGIQRTPNSIDSHRLIDFAGRQGSQDPTVEALFRAYFLDGKDIGDIDTLVEIGAEVGLDVDLVRPFLESDEAIDRINAEDAMAREMGVTGVPCFLLNRKYAISGAQEPAAFLQAFDLLVEEAAKEIASADSD